MLVRSQRSQAQVIREARARRQILARLAREDVNVFAEFVLRDESTGRPVVQAPTHVAWHDLADHHSRLLLWSHVDAGKTQQISIVRTLWELGRDPNLRFLILSNTKEQARKVARSIRAYIESSRELRDVFPHLRAGEPWGEYAFAVQRKTRAKDPSVQTSGVHGNVLGSRLDVVQMDDVLDYENTRTEDGRKDLVGWYDATVIGRITPGGRQRCVGTAFHPNDLMHVLGRRHGWAAFKYPVIDPETKQSRWPQRWPLERVEERRKETTPIEFARQMLCEARDDAASRFKREWIDAALRLGDGTALTMGLTMVPRGYRIFTGVDLAVQQKDSADLTVLFTIAVDPIGMRSVLSIESGRWSGPEIVSKIVSTHRRFQSIVVVENNAAQDFILQFTRDRPEAVPLVPFTTGRNKAHPEFGIEGLAVELANGRWRIPNQGGVMHPEVSAWVDEMLFYNPAAHTGDRLMASWFAREGIKVGDRRPAVVPRDFHRR